MQQADLPALRIRIRYFPLRLLPMPLVARTTLHSTLVTSIFVSLFSTIPGLVLWHHVGAAIFAHAAATWCLCNAVHAHAHAHAMLIACPKVWRAVYVKYALAATQFAAWACFGVLWCTVKLGVPHKLIPNKDPRFIVLALLEYIATAALLLCIRLVATDISSKCLVLSLSRSH
jgi:hypothetical protein